jgi:hypothetical protein
MSDYDRHTEHLQEMRKMLDQATNRLSSALDRVGTALPDNPKASALRGEFPDAPLPHSYIDQYMALGHLLENSIRDLDHLVVLFEQRVFGNSGVAVPTSMPAARGY